MYTRRAQHQHVDGSLAGYLQADHSFDLQHSEPSQPITQNPCVTKELDDELKRDKEMEEREREGENISIMLYGHKH